LFWSIMVAIVIGGVLAYYRMPKLEDPEICAKQANVVVVYPGATAHDIELKAVQRIEQQLRTLPDVEEIRSDCQRGMALITVEFKMTVLNEDLEQHFDLLRRKINDVTQQLPSDCYAPMVIDDMMDVYGLFYALECPGYDYNDMMDYAKLLQRELLAVDGVKRVNLSGGRDEVINIVLNKDQIARNGLLPTQIMMQLQGQGATVNAGKAEQAGDRYQLRVSAALNTVDDVRDLMIKTADGKQMRLGDIAEVKREYKEPQTNAFFVDGKQSIAICIALQSGVIVPDVGKAVDAKLAEVMKRMPAGMTTEKIFFQPDKVNDAVESFIVNLIESVLIVILVLVFAMGWRSGVIIGLGLILTICLSFVILLMLGCTLQRISLGAFIIAMGMLVDNAIVIMDGILVDRKRGVPYPNYLFNIGNKTAMPLIGATVIAVSAFLSAYLSPDTAGEYCRDMFLVLCVSLLVSWVLALIQVPICADAWLPKRKENEEQGGEPALSPVHRFFRRSVAFLLGHKALAIVTMVVLLVLSVMNVGKVKNLFFPDFDYKQFVVEYQLPTDAGPDRVQHDLLEITARLDSNPDIDRVAAVTGSAPAHYCLVRPVNNGGDNYGELMIDCKDFETVKKVVKEIRPQLRELYPDAYIRFRFYNFSIGTSHTVEVQFMGPDPAVLRDLSRQAEEIMRKCPYVDPYSVENNWRPKGKTLIANYVNSNALRSGITRSNVGDALQAAGDGLAVGVMNDKDYDKMIVINMQVRNADGSRIADLRDIPVWSMLNVNVDADALGGLMTGATKQSDLQKDMFNSVPLSDIAGDIGLDWEETYVRRVNGQRCIEAECDPNPDIDAATTTKVQTMLKDDIEKIPLPDGYTMRWGGEIKTQDKAMVNILSYFPLILFIVMCILLLLFNSWKQVLLILMCLPFVFVGIIPGMIWLKVPFTFMAIIGMMGLIGMMVKNGIVLVDEINRLRNEDHKDGFTAVVDATVSRVRPVIMASLTTILGMAPLLTDVMYNSMAITIMAGLTVGTIITLILLPVLYAALYGIKPPKSTSPEASSNPT